MSAPKRKPLAQEKRAFKTNSEGVPIMPDYDWAEALTPEEEETHHARTHLLWVRYVAYGDLEHLGGFFSMSDGRLKGSQSFFLLCVIAGVVKFKGRPSEELDRMEYSSVMRNMADIVGAKSMSDFLRDWNNLDLSKSSHFAEHKKLKNMVSDGKNPWKQTIAAARRNYKKVRLDPELVSGLMPSI